MSLLPNNMVFDATTLPGSRDMPYLINNHSTNHPLHYFPGEVSSRCTPRL